MALKVDFTFDEKTYRHYMNGFLSVLHCHHYLCLTTKLALDFDDLGGTRILKEVAEDTMRPLFDDYIRKNGVDSFAERILVGIEYYAVMGLGKMKVSANEQGGKVQLVRSHVDQGWLTKWGKSEAHVNYFTCGYIAAMFAAAVDKPARSVSVTETESIATGSDSSILQVKIT
jgi:hypothetical protein